MAVSITLSDGDTVLVYRNGGVAFEFVDAQALPATAPVQVANQFKYWLDAIADPSGGFTIAWAGTSTSGDQVAGQLYSASYDSTGALVTPAHAISSWTGFGAPLAFTSSDHNTPDGRIYSGGVSGGSAGASLILNLSPDWGFSKPEGPPVLITSGPGGGIAGPVAGALAGGGDVAAYVLSGRGAGATTTYALTVSLAGPDGGQLQSITAATLNGPGNMFFGNYAVSGLADGGFVLAWQQETTTGFNTFAVETFFQEYDAQGRAVGGLVDLGAVKAGSAAPSIIALPSGAYSLTWTDAAGTVQHGSYAEQGVPLGAVDIPPPPPPPTGEHVVYTNPPYPLTASAGWTGAAVLSNHLIAVVNDVAGAFGSTTAAEHTYTFTNDTPQSVILQGYAGAGQTLTPEITALPVGGFFKVGYAGSTDYEVYNANDQLVFQHNAYTSPTAALAPLVGGGYVVTDSAANVFGLYDANAANIGWIAMPSNASGAPTVTALVGGGFAFTFAGSSALDVYDASGHLLGASALGATPSSFASAAAALPNAAHAFGGLLDVWLSPDGGQFGLPTTIELQAFDSSGVARFAPLQVGQDLDPWRTSFQIQAHADGSAAILWSQGGGVFAAEYDNGAVGPTYAALAGDLATTNVIELPHNTVGLTWVQGGDVWAEIFDPATGAAQRADLGATTGDASTVHALALSGGGMAISWHTAAGVESQVLTAAGQLGSAPVLLMGDLIGVNAANGTTGLGVTLADDGHGTPFVQYLSNSNFNDGFWLH